MPAHIRKGLITGAPAFNSGGLGLSIGSRVGGIRHRIAERAPDSGKRQLSFVVDFSDFQSAPNITTFYGLSGEIGFNFIYGPTSTQHPTYSILQNKNNVFLRSFVINDYDICGNSILGLPLSKYIINATSSRFEIEIPSINGTDLSNINVTDYSQGFLVFELFGPELFKGTISQSFNDGNTFFIVFSIATNTPLEQAKTMLQNYTGKTYKFELYSNDTGAVTVVGGNTYGINKFSV